MDGYVLPRLLTYEPMNRVFFCEAAFVCSCFLLLDTMYCLQLALFALAQRLPAPYLSVRNRTLSQ